MLMKTFSGSIHYYISTCVCTMSLFTDTCLNNIIMWYKYIFLKATTSIIALTYWKKIYGVLRNCNIKVKSFDELIIQFVHEVH